MEMRKELKYGNQSEMVREKSNFKRAAIHLKYFRRGKKDLPPLVPVSMSGVGKEGSLL